MSPLLVGKLGELLACKVLEKKGYTIWKRNWRHPLGELDIVCFDKKILVVVEVKTRCIRAGRHYTPLDNVTKEKEKRLEYLARLFVRKHDRHLLRLPLKKTRIDLVSISIHLPRWPRFCLCTITHHRGWDYVDISQLEKHRSNATVHLAHVKNL